MGFDLIGWIILIIWCAEPASPIDTAACRRVREPCSCVPRRGRIFIGGTKSYGL